MLSNSSGLHRYATFLPDILTYTPHRQLEAIVRISESLAKMSLSPFALESHVDEALRLFQVSTLDAALSGSLSGAEGFTSNADQEEVRKIERQLKNRFPIGSNVSEQRIIQDFLKQVCRYIRRL